MKNGRNSATISSILQLLYFVLILSVGSHLVKDVSDKRLETALYFLADGCLWDVRILFSQFVTNLNDLIVEFCG